MRVAADAYVAAGLARNPFAIPEDDAATPLVPGPATGQAPEPGRQRLVQVLGERGAGKTTTLRAWRARRPGPYHWVPPRGASRWHVPPVAAIAYWDELDRLPGWVLRLAFDRAARTAATIVAGTHVDLGPPASRAGLEVVTVTFPPITADRLARWFDQSVAAVAISDAAGNRPHQQLDRPTPDEFQAMATTAATSWRVGGDCLHAWTAQAVRSPASSEPTTTPLGGERGRAGLGH